MTQRLLIACAAFWFLNREPSAIPLKYGEFKQLLLDPTVSFRKVKVGRADIRGDGDQFSGATHG